MSEREPSFGENMEEGAQEEKQPEWVQKFIEETQKKVAAEHNLTDAESELMLKLTADLEFAGNYNLEGLTNEAMEKLRQNPNVHEALKQFMKEVGSRGITWN